MELYVNNQKLCCQSTDIDCEKQKYHFIHLGWLCDEIDSRFMARIDLENMKIVNVEIDWKTTNIRDNDKRTELIQWFSDNETELVDVLKNGLAKKIQLIERCKALFKDNPDLVIMNPQSNIDKDLETALYKLGILSVRLKGRYMYEADFNEPEPTMEGFDPTIDDPSEFTFAKAVELYNSAKIEYKTVTMPKIMKGVENKTIKRFIKIIGDELIIAYFEMYRH